MDLEIFIILFVITSLLISFYFERKEEEEKEKASSQPKKECDDCKLGCCKSHCHACKSSSHMEIVCDTCELRWCKYCCRYEECDENLDYYFINSISKNCKKCRDPDLIIHETKLKRPLCFSCVEDGDDENMARFYDNVYQCDFCRRTFCEYHGKLTEYENVLHSWNGECHFCLISSANTM